jgi:hypothetical protein
MCVGQQNREVFGSHFRTRPSPVALVVAVLQLTAWERIHASTSDPVVPNHVAVDAIPGWTDSATAPRRKSAMFDSDQLSQFTRGDEGFVVAGRVTVGQCLR